MAELAKSGPRSLFVASDKELAGIAQIVREEVLPYVHVTRNQKLIERAHKEVVSGERTFGRYLTTAFAVCGHNPRPMAAIAARAAQCDYRPLGKAVHEHATSIVEPVARNWYVFESCLRAWPHYDPEVMADLVFSLIDVGQRQHVEALIKAGLRMENVVDGVQGRIDSLTDLTMRLSFGAMLQSLALKGVRRRTTRNPRELGL
jgi:hypothetical protein